MNITTQIIATRNDNDLLECVKSAQKLGKVVIVDIFNQNIKIENAITVNHNPDSISKIRNKIANEYSDEYNLYLHPWETIEFDSEIDFDCARIYVSYGDFLTKETRIWKKGVLFEGEVVEKLDTNNLIDCFIVSNNGYDELFEINANKYLQKNPHTSNGHYYKSCLFLKQKKYKDYLVEAETFLFNASDSPAKVLTHYHCAIINNYLNRFDKALGHIVAAITLAPLLAELWCLMGDAFIKMNQPARAISFYDNAIILGSKRKRNDQYFIDIPKYKEYPEMKIQEYRDKLKSIIGDERN